ncbi:KICSTOR complex protein C12orf66 like protein [Argiope bruennichi]|uniref:KICSTOR complex protein C12orf66 like protein n=1 Tax=Argiope bruennichi TaxID=94029 RepID=A0A8T0F575_ARGBR|nr:KICSTOR complex protein C12orf66 like protein [Argiope bruennichi]
MSENAEDVIIKQQTILDNFFNLLGSFSYDKAKEYLEKERDLAVKNHTVAPFFSSALSAFASLAAAEKNYANFMFLGPKGFLRKDSSLKSMYEGLMNEYQRLEEKHYITPVSTPTMSPSSSYRTPSPPSSSPVSVGSEVSGSAASSFGSTGSVRGSTHNLPAYLGEDVLENLASHLCGQLLSFVRARLKTMEFYEKMYSMGSNRYMKFDGFFTNGIKKISTAVSSKPPPAPGLYTWLRNLKAALVSKFTLYFHEILSKQTTPADMKNFCAKASFDYFSKITSFQKKYDVACIAIVLDTAGLDDFSGHGYCHPQKAFETPKGLDSFPPIVSYPPNFFSQEKLATHWPSVVMIMNNKEQDIRNTETAVSIFDPRMNATYFLSKIEARMTLVVIFESKKTERDSHIHRFMQLLCTQLRGNKLFTSIKPGSK